MTERHVLLVGSMPFENEEAAMTRALDLTEGRLLAALPDGEIGEKSERYPKGNRAAWVQAIIDVCEQDASSWEVISRGERGADGFPTGYETGPQLRPRHPPRRMDRHLDFRWVDYFQSSYPIFKRLEKERDLDGLRFQVGLPTGIGMTFGMMSPPNALRYAGAFSRRMAWEANRILDLSPDRDLLFQLEVPGELALAHKLPKALSGLASRSVIGLLEQVRPEVPFGVHLCFGDLNNEALIDAKTLDKAVAFANGLLDRWPVSHRLAYVHFPLAEAAQPPPMDEAYYAPLGDLVLPKGVRFVAGFVHEELDDGELRRLLEIVERVRGESVDVASSCGLGRRPPDVADKLIRAATALAS